MFSGAVLLLIGLFLLIYGIMHGTNIKIIWMEGICALAAFVAGVICVIQAVIMLT